MMMLNSVLLLVSMAGVMEALDLEVCYGKYGCFSKEGSLERLPVLLPQSPEKIGTTFRLFTREQSTEHILDDSDADKLSSSTFDGTRRTIILIHGWYENGYIPWMNRMRKALLEQEDVNLITTDWSNGAVTFWYYQAAGNTRLVGVQVAELIKFLIKNTGTSADLFYIVGFSFGAQTAGYAGARMREDNQPIGRITGLDAAGWGFRNVDIDLRLDPTDAQFVDGIHTDTDIVGYPFNLGHIDFYVNGGKTQPKGCDTAELHQDVTNLLIGPVADFFTCDHMRAPDYYTESVQSQCPMHAYPCESLDDFERGRCLKCNGDCPLMGYSAQSTTGDATGKHILLTNQSPPFCAYHYLVTFKTGTKWFSGFLIAQIVIWIDGSDGDSGDVYLKRRIIGTGSEESFVALSQKYLGNLHSIRVSLESTIESWYLESAVVKPALETKEYTACFNTWVSSSSSSEKDFENGNISCR